MAQDLRKFFQPGPRFQRADEGPAGPLVSVLESPGKFVDLFAGYGGASTGATNAGYDVVLAVDNWEHAVGVHQRNHPQADHLCMELPPAEPLPLPEAGEKWHLHGSPPCTFLSVAARYARSEERVAREEAEGLALVRWYLDFALGSSATTWSMEQVAHEGVIKLLKAYRAQHRESVAWHVFDFAKLGLPQHRKRLIAGTPALINKLKRTRKRRIGPRDVLAHPRGTHIRNETLYQGSKSKPETRIKYTASDMAKSISKPCYTIVAYKPLRWVTPGAEDPKATLIRLNSYESSRIQGFPEGYYLPEGVVLATRGVGNAVPPPVMEQLLTPRGRCVSPSLVWRPP